MTVGNDKGPAGAPLLDDLLTRAEPALAGYLLGKLRPADSPSEAAFPCRDLFTTAGFDSAIARFTARYPGVDRRAVVSLWSLYYFSTLTIAPIVLWRRLGLVLPLALEETSLVTAPDMGTAEAFILAGAGTIVPKLSVTEALAPMIEGHLRPAIDFISGHCRLSPRLLWCNAAGYIDWIIRALDPGNENAEGLELFASRKLADGSDNPLQGLITRIPHAGGNGLLSQRKVCCLRYLVPSVGGCGETCPLPQGRRLSPLPDQRQQ